MNVSRRTLVKGSAWTVPAIAVAATAPVMAASPGIAQLRAGAGTAISRDLIWSDATTCRNPILPSIAIPDVDGTQMWEVLAVGGDPDGSYDPDFVYVEWGETGSPNPVPVPHAPFIAGVTSDDITINEVTHTFGYGFFQTSASGNYEPMTNSDGSVENPQQTWINAIETSPWGNVEFVETRTMKRDQFASAKWPTNASNISFNIYRTTLNAGTAKAYQKEGVLDGETGVFLNAPANFLTVSNGEKASSAARHIDYANGADGSACSADTGWGIYTYARQEVKITYKSGQTETLVFERYNVN